MKLFRSGGWARLLAPVAMLAGIASAQAADDIVIGGSIPLSGVFAFAGQGIHAGLGDYVKMVNEFGGQMPNAIGVPEEQLRQAAKLSVCKINIDSDLRLAMTGTIRKFMAEHPDKFDPREYLKPARANIKELVRHKLVDVLGCAGKA